MNPTLKAINSLFSRSTNLLGYSFYPIIFLFFLLISSCNEESGIQSSREVDPTNSKISARTPSLQTVYVSNDSDFDISYPTSSTAVLDFEGDYVWTDNADTQGTPHAMTDIRITVFCTCISISGDCTVRGTDEAGNSEYSCNQNNGCSVCELDITVECSTEPTIEIPNGITIRKDN